jgi:hypothetical protein
MLDAVARERSCLIAADGRFQSYMIDERIDARLGHRRRARVTGHDSHLEAG